MEELSKTYNPKETEAQIYKKWEESGYFGPLDPSPQPSPSRGEGEKFPPPLMGGVGEGDKKPFVISIPPPNVTGSLHMGHALNNTLQDILIRYHRMKGVPTLWVPGTDHAGIATQNKVEQELATDGTTRFDLGREKFIEKVWEWKEKYGNIILDQLKKLGCSCDWSRTRFTMDQGYSKAVITAFVNYYNKGYIYQGERIVNWCPRCGTSLSDLELVDKESKGKLWYIKYKIKSQIPISKSQTDQEKYIIVATTRPETMLGDTAVAVNPEDARYKDLIGQTVILPLLGREIPIVADAAIEMEFGTGALKVTPGSDPADFEIGERHGLPVIKIIDEKGVITDEGGPYAGQDRYAARKQVVKDLEAQGLLEKIEEYTHNIPLCYRCDTVVELILSLQWFVKMKELIKPTIEAIKKEEVKFIPERWAKVALDWSENIRDWCISRQIWWGHRLPVYYRQSELKIKSEKLKRDPSTPLRSAQDDNNNIYVGEEPPKGWVQDEDVLDTWFSSALWPFATLGWPIACGPHPSPSPKMGEGWGEGCVPETGTDLYKFYPTTVLSTARDIIYLWVTRMIFSGLEFMGQVPFSKVYIHPTMFNKQGKRMSKSLGTGVDPLELIDKYGADATRFGLAFQDTGVQDMKFGEEAMVAGRNFANKIWNASRFIMMKLEGRDRISAAGATRDPISLGATDLGEISEFIKTEEDKKIIARMKEIIASTNENLEKFRFGQVAHDLYDFFWHDFCDVYLEKSKAQLEVNETKKSTEIILLAVLLNSLKLIHPLMPHITEAIYQALPIEGKKEFLMIESWPTV